MSNRYCLVLPHFNHAKEFAVFLPKLVSTNLPCVIVDDGSDATELQALKDLITGQENLKLFEHKSNRGKGAAVMTAMVHARQLGMTHGFQVDADGQHNYEDIPRFIAASEQHPEAIICGRPVFDRSAPKARVYGRKVTDFWVALETVSLQIKDGLCGFRVYPIDQLERLTDRYFFGARMDFDTELLVKAVWQNVPLRFLDTKVQYIEDGRSHFHYLRDNLVLVKLHVRLMFGMLVRLPWLLANKLR